AAHSTMYVCTRLASLAKHRQHAANVHQRLPPPPFGLFTRIGVTGLPNFLPCFALSTLYFTRLPCSRMYSVKLRHLTKASYPRGLDPLTPPRHDQYLSQSFNVNSE